MQFLIAEATTSDAKIISRFLCWDLSRLTFADRTLLGGTSQRNSSPGSCMCREGNDVLVHRNVCLLRKRRWYLSESVSALVITDSPRSADFRWPQAAVDGQLHPVHEARIV